MSELIMMVGLPRSGKSWWAHGLNHGLSVPIVSPDAIRRAFHGEAFVAQAEGFVWATAHVMADALFLAGHNRVILDACSITRKRRDEWPLKPLWGKRRFVYVATPLEVCRRRLEEERELIETEEPPTQGAYERAKKTIDATFEALDRMAENFESVARSEGKVETVSMTSSTKR